MQEKSLKTASRYNTVKFGSMHETFDIIYGHNFNSVGSPMTLKCEVKRTATGWSMCGGYQPWMDEYVPNALHLIMISEPLERMASMYYYERGYTKQKDGAPGDEAAGRINSDAERFLDPRGADQEYIHKWLVREFFDKWERVQWWWIRDGTAERTLAEAMQLLAERFTVGLTSRFEETLLLWRRRMQLPLRDFFFAALKAGLSHPKFADWSEADQATGRKLAQETGDLEYYAAALVGS